MSENVLHSSVLSLLEGGARGSESMEVKEEAVSLERVDLDFSRASCGGFLEQCMNSIRIFYNPTKYNFYLTQYLAQWI